MKKSLLQKILPIIIIFVVLVSINISYVSANEPIMQEKYNIEEQKIKRAQFIWNACIEELRRDKVLSNEDVDNIHIYLKDKKTSNNNETQLKKCDREKKSLQVNSIDNMIKEKIITVEQGNMLRKKLNKYDLSNLDN